MIVAILQIAGIVLFMLALLLTGRWLLNRIVPEPDTINYHSAKVKGLKKAWFKYNAVERKKGRKAHLVDFAAGYNASQANKDK